MKKCMLLLLCIAWLPLDAMPEPISAEDTGPKGYVVKLDAANTAVNSCLPVITDVVIAIATAESDVQLNSDRFKVALGARLSGDPYVLTTLSKHFSTEEINTFYSFCENVRLTELMKKILTMLLLSEHDDVLAYDIRMLESRISQAFEDAEANTR